MHMAWRPAKEYCLLVDLHSSEPMNHQNQGAWTCTSPVSPVLVVFHRGTKGFSDVLICWVFIFEGYCHPTGYEASPHVILVILHLK